MEELNETIGIVLRYADNLLAKDKDIDTIAAHNEILRKQGRAFVGKVGKFIGTKAINICNNEEISKYLILVKKGKSGYIFHSAPICSAQSTYPPSQLIPEYYRAEKEIASWICINGPLHLMSEKEIKSWIIKSSRFNIVESLRSSMASYFIAVKK